MSTDHPIDTDIIAAHQSNVFLLAMRTGPDDDGPFWSAQCTAHHGTCSWPGVDTLTRDEAVRAHAAHVAEALTAARTIETVDELDALPVGTVVLADGDVYVSYDNLLTTWREWIYPGDDDPQQSIPLPARILHLPDSKDPS